MYYQEGEYEIMAESYCGVRVAQNYKYKFVCEHCKQEVTKESVASVLVVAGGSTKATTTFTISSAGYNALVSQGRKLFPQLNKPVQEMFDNHNYMEQKALPLNNNFANQSTSHIQGLNDECKYCEKIQHWHDFSTSGLAVCIAGASIVAVISFFVSWFICINFIQLGNPTSPLISAVVALVLSSATFIWMKIDDNKIQKQRKDLENLEKTYPVLIGWGTEWDEPINMKISG